MSDTHPLPRLSAAEARDIDRACDRFEAAWLAGQRPDPAEYLESAGPARAALLRQLLLLDWEYRRRAGDEPCAGDYHARFPGDSAVIADVSREVSESPASTRGGSDSSRACAGAGRAARPDEPPPGEFDAARYDLLREVGHGGIGVVFRARDRHLGRELAVKVLREEYRDDADALRRFTEEARVGSRLQHPAIVPVYEQGWFADRRPYFTMKLVEGHTLAALLRERADAERDLPRLLGVFEQVCQAMAYAHARGVVHRDLKPSNVMVGEFGEVQVMDWGFAKVIAGDQAGDGGAPPSPPGSPAGGPPGVTHSGALMGTPAYMPPEQARGEAALVDRRADVFALGAILCEILTGRPPYAGGDADAVCRQAAAGDLRDAHARLGACGADEALTDLARRCLAAERAGRPPDAGAVARDLTAYFTSAQERLRQAQLEWAAAEARAQEAAAKARAERRARRLTLALAAAVLLLLLGAAAAPTVGFVLLRSEQQQTEKARRAADSAREDEAKRRQRARQALDMLTGPVIEEWLGKQAVVSAEQRKFLEQALAIYTEFASETSKDPASRAGLANAYHRVGIIQRALGRMPQAEVAFDRGAALYAQLTSESPDRLEYRNDLVRLLNNRLLVLTATGRDEEAETALRDLVKREREMVAQAPDTEIRNYLALSLTNLSNVAREKGKLPEAEALAREAVGLYQGLVAENPRERVARHGLARSLSSLATALAARGRHADAERMYREALKEHEPLAARSPNVPQIRHFLATTHAYLANLLRDTGRPREAEAGYREAIKGLRQLSADFPTHSAREVRQDLARVYTCLAEALRLGGRLPECEAASRQALRIYDQLAAAFRGHPDLRSDLAAAHNNLGFALSCLGRSEEAAESFRKAIAVYEKLTAQLPNRLNDRRHLAQVYSGLAATLLAMGRPREVEAAYREAVDIYRALAGARPAEPENRHQLAGALADFARWHHERGARDEARRLLNEALPHHRAALGAKPHHGPYRQSLCTTWIGLALTHLAEGRHAEAGEAADRLAEEAAAAKFPVELMKAAALLARCATLAGQDTGLLDSRRQALAQSYAERAMTTLRLAVKHGFRDTARLREDRFFASVHSRPDFQQLLAELNKGTWKGR